MRSLRREGARQAAQQRRLARAVPADHGSYLAGRRAQGDPVQRELPPILNGYLVHSPATLLIARGAGGRAARPAGHAALRALAGARYRRNRSEARVTMTAPSKARKTNGCQSAPIGSARSITPREISLK